MDKMEMNTPEKLRLMLIRCGQKLRIQHGGHQTQGRILKILYYQGPMTQRALQEKLDIQAGSMSEIAAKLENKGFIHRDKAPTDKRKILLTLTETGRADVENFQRHSGVRRNVNFDVLTKEEQQLLLHLLEKLLSRWSETEVSDH